MADVFISYSSKNRAEARKVVDGLKDKKIHCWIDIEDIPKGIPYDDYIPEAISQCRVIVMLICASSMASENVKNELRLAIHYKKPVIPFMLEDTELKDAFLYHINANNRIFAYQNWHSAIENLISTVTKYVPQEDTAEKKEDIVDKEESSSPSTSYILKNAVNEYSQHSLPEMRDIAENDIIADYALLQEHIQNSCHSTESQLVLGRRYLYGHSLAKDEKKAVYWLSKAASSQNSHALFLLGSCFACGKGVSENLACAAYCYELSASQPNPHRDAIFETASCYAYKMGVSYDPLKSAYWFRKASELERQDIRQAKNFAGVAYTFKYIDLLKNSHPDIVEKLRANGYSMDDVSEEHIQIVEQMHKEHIEKLDRVQKKRNEELEQIRQKRNEQMERLNAERKAKLVQVEKETKQTKTIDRMLFIGCGVLVILAVYSFILGIMEKPLLTNLYSAIALAMILIGTILVTPKLAKTKQKEPIISTILSAILIGIFLMIAIAVCAWLIYQLGRGVAALFTFLFCCAALAIFLLVFTGGRR